MEIDTERKSPVEIRKGVPLPKTQACKLTAAGVMARKMDVNDMVFFGDEAAANALAYAGRKAGFTMVRRKCEMDGARGWGVWRTE